MPVPEVFTKDMIYEERGAYGEYLPLFRTAAQSGNPAATFRAAANFIHGGSVLTEAERMFDDLCVPEGAELESEVLLLSRYDRLSALWPYNIGVGAESSLTTTGSHHDRADAIHVVMASIAILLSEPDAKPEKVARFSQLLGVSPQDYVRINNLV